MNAEEIEIALREGKAAKEKLNKLLPICREILDEFGAQSDTCNCALCRLSREVKPERPFDDPEKPCQA